MMTLNLTRNARYFSTHNFQNVNRLEVKDTIYALSTGFGKSAIAVIRISGDDTQ